MAQGTKIQWCDDTVNPASGCDGCELYNARAPEQATCYAKRIHEERLARYDWQHYAPKFSEVRMIPGRLWTAAKWSDLRGKLRPSKPWLDLLPRTIFVGDLSDVMSAAVTDAFIEEEIFAPMESEKGRRHVWMLLTKRPRRLAELSMARPGGLPANCLAMTSVTSQAAAEARVPWLLRARARWHGISAEPLLGPVSLAGWLSPGLDWVILGGESGPGARPCELAWVQSLLAQCQAGGVTCFVKQLGAAPVREGMPLGLRDAKGGDMGEWTVGLCMRALPALDVEVVV